ncbi:hypothetical protein J3F83DRAFT_747513 [Trichoderma novae-zelandiae]
MAVDALKNLVNNIPSWQARLDELSSQVDKRQLELAALAAANSTKEPETRSLRNKGSTESLKPKDDGAMHIFFSEDVPVQQQDVATTPPLQNIQQRRSSPPSPAEEKRPAPPKFSTDASAASSNRVAKKSRTTSIASADGPRQTYRTRSMIIVYYDSYVQGFFDDLVRFISSSRNLMRKAKMAAKVAQIKKLAEMDVPDDENADGDDKAAEALPSLRYISSRRYGPTAIRLGHPSLANQAPDVFDELDKALEFVQSTCEHGAHQFLRDARCNDEVSKIQQRIGEVLDMAKKEMERVEREEPETLNESTDPKPRTMKPITVSRTMVPHHKEADDVHSRKLEVADSAAPRLPALHMTDRIEADPNAGDDDFDTEAMLARIRYTSSRQMRMRAVVN